MTREPPALHGDATDETAPTPAPAAPVGWTRGLAITLATMGAAALITGMLLRLPPVMCVNDKARWNTIWALLEHGRCWWVGPGPWFTIDRCTYDVVKNDEDAAKAHWYASKPPFMQVLLTGVAWPICKAGGFDFKEDHNIVGRAMLILVNAGGLVVFIVLFGRLLIKLGVDGFAFGFSLITAAVGTYVTGWCVTLNNHILAAFCAMIAVYALYTIATRREAGWVWYAVGGLFAGLVFAFETPGMAIAGFGGLLALTYDRRRALTAYLPAVLLPIAAFFLANYLCTDRWIPFQWTHPKYYDPYWLNPTDIDAVHEPKSVYLFHIVLGHHGVFSLTPVFLLSLVGFARHLRDAQNPLRRLAVMSAATIVAVIAFYVIMTHNYAGTCHGLRWLFWLVPFWLLMLPAGVTWIARLRGGRTTAIVLLAISMFSVAYALPRPWGRSWLHELFFLAGIVDY
jgi:hypothetical protein